MPHFKFITLIYFCCAVAMTTNAATILVTASDGLVAENGECSISEAIMNANNIMPEQTDCNTGFIHDTIVLTQDVIIATAYENDDIYGRTGTPAIETEIIIDGKGFSISRDNSLNCNLDGISTPDEFRIMRTTSGADLVLQNIKLINGCADGVNFESRGAGLFNFANLSIIDTAFKQNQSYSAGGALYHGFGILDLINNSLFVDNQSISVGGAILADSQSPINRIQNSTLLGNSALYGGAIYNSQSNIGSILNSTFSGNSASITGGAIYNSNNLSSITVNNSLFHNNSSSECLNDVGSFNGNNNISDNNLSQCPGIIATTLSANSVAPLADNGGPTMTLALLAGSEALDAADTVTNTGTATSADQRGAFVHNIRDIGAYEYSPFFDQCHSLQVDGFSTTVSNSDELIHALNCSNSNGDIRDTIALSQDIVLVETYDNNSIFGKTGTPPIETPLILDGNGFNITRDSRLDCVLDESNTNSEFRLLRTTFTADLILQNIELSHGCSDGVDNSKSYGGALYNNGILSISNAIFRQNQATFSGGGIFHGGGQLDLINNSSFIGNYAKFGGAIQSRAKPIGDIIGSTFSGNTAQLGGAVHFWGSTVNGIINSTFSGNTSTNGNAGAIFNESSSIDSILNNTFANNSADRSAAIYNYMGSITELNNSLFVNNGLYECVSVDGSIEGNNNLSSLSINGCPGSSSVDLNISFVGQLADNGGPTMTHALLSGSQAIDAADTEVNTGTSTITDQRGQAFKNIRDIGAYEYTFSFDVCPSAFKIDGFTTNVGRITDLIEAIECSNLNGTNKDTIVLSQDIIILTPYENDAIYGRTGTPTIEHNTQIDGNGYTLSRYNNLNCVLDDIGTDEEFRLLRTKQSSDLTLENITLINGCADGPGLQGNGAGIFNQSRGYITHVVFNQNQAANDGGGLFQGVGFLDQIKDCSFQYNSAKNGGGIAIINGLISYIENSTFSNNFASEVGGAISNNLSNISYIINSTFSANEALISGGAINNLIANMNTVYNSTFVGNLSPIGGAIYNKDGITDHLHNSIFYNNGENDCKHLGSGRFNGSNNITDNLSSSCPGLLSATLNSNSIDSLKDNGGSTMTHALLIGSEAIDAADTYLNTGTATATDQRGFGTVRIRDIGAFESDINPCATDFETDGFVTSVGNSSELIKAIRCSNLNGDITDTINLSQDITLSTTIENNSIYGRTGTPNIQTHLLLDGNGFKLMRDSSLNCDLNEISVDSEFRLLRAAQSATLTLQNITLSNGCADGTGLQRNGGALYNDSDLVILNTEFSRNKANFDGGGLFHSNQTLSLISNSSFIENQARNGGAISNLNGPIDTIENSTFSGNFSINVGGAISNYLSTISNILNSTFSGNSAQTAGAIFNANGTISALNNSLFHNNNNFDCFNNYGSFNGSNNITDNLLKSCPGQIETNLNAESVAPLADNGGSTLTHALLAGSTAMNAADSVTNTGTATLIDQRGFAADNRRDIGAYEAQVPVVTAPDDIILEATGATTAVLLGEATVKDTDQPGLFAIVNNSGPFSVGEHTVSWVATDSQGHVGSDTQTITITDNTAPSIVLNDNESVQIIIGGNYSMGATATDLVDGDLTLEIIIGGDIVNVNTSGTYVVTYTVSDQAGNTAQLSQTINVRATILVTVSGLHPSNAIELSTKWQSLNFTSNGSISFNPVDNGTDYTVLLTAQPTSPNQTCIIAGGSNGDGSGMITGENVDITVTCTTNVYFIGGTVNGLIADNNLVIRNNLSDNLLITDDGIFVFATAIEDLQNYDISIFLQPDDPIQNCTISNATGAMAGNDVINVNIECEFGNDMIYRHGFEGSPAVSTTDLN